MSRWGLRSLYYLNKIQVRPTVGDIRYSCFSVQTALSFLPTQLPADSFTSHAGIMLQVRGGAHVPGTRHPHRSWRRCCSFLPAPGLCWPVLLEPVVFTAVCLAFVFTVGPKVGKEEQVYEHSNKGLV